MSRHGQMRVTYTARGLPRYEVEIYHDELSKYQLIRGEEQNAAAQKANAKMAEWDDIWARRAEREKRITNVGEKKKSAEEQTEEAQTNLTSLENTLKYALKIGSTFTWNSLKDNTDYPAPKPHKFELRRPDLPEIPLEPLRNWPQFAVKFGFLDNLSRSRRDKKEKEAYDAFNNVHSQWESDKTQLLNKHDEELQQFEIEKQKQEVEYKKAIENWEKDRLEYIQKREEKNANIDKQTALYKTGDANTIIDYCDHVLSSSIYPDYFPNSYELDYNSENKILLIDFQLPTLGSIPTLKEVRYVQSTDKFSETHITEAQLNKLYDNLLYQITLRSLYKLFKADKENTLSAIVFNGYVKSKSAATGQEINPCVLSLQANKVEFSQIDLANVEPKICFKQLKGVGSSKLYSMTAIAPIMKMDRSDKRFIASYDVEGKLNEAVNLALIDWEDFEHLVRELFEEEYGGPGNEVKVTQASRDGGVDAVAFDSDPVRGGKVVIQAKRYTNTVGVSAVRDLFGTVMNEGAMKGILVTTSDYGPDAYEFAKGKPLTLLNGSNLLFLLEKHGHKAKIDLHEAKVIMAQERKDLNENAGH